MLQHRGESSNPTGSNWLQHDLEVGDTGIGVGAQSGCDILDRVGYLGQEGRVAETYTGDDGAQLDVQ